MGADRALGVRFSKPSVKDWHVAEWAVVGGNPKSVLAFGSIRPPKTYDEAEALRHLHEGIHAAAKENQIAATFVWKVENIARVNVAMRPRIRAEGAVASAAALSGSSVSLVAWSEISKRTHAGRDKSEYVEASEVCGIAVGNADPQAVLVAVAALKG